jgi:hypothetical protein
MTPCLHPGEEVRAVPLAIEHDGEAVQKRVRFKLLGDRLIGHIPFKTRNDVSCSSVCSRPGATACHRVDLIASRCNQAQTLARDIVFGQLLLAVVNVAIGIEDGCLFGRHHPLFAQFGTPLKRLSLDQPDV